MKTRPAGTGMYELRNTKMPNKGLEIQKQPAYTVL